jgi:hypothetical protein
VVRLDDRQLKIVMTAAAFLAVEKRDTFLQRVAAELERVRRPGDRDVEAAAQVALKGLLQAPAA